MIRMIFHGVIATVLIANVVRGCHYEDSSGPKQQIVSTSSTASIHTATGNETSLVWTHMDTGAVIGRSSSGNFLLLGDSSTYTAEISEQTISGEIRFVYNLTMTTNRMTEGVYRVEMKCPQANDSMTISSSAYYTVIINATAPKSGTLGMRDLTSCCNSSSVSTTCLPVCRPSSLNFLTFKFEQCSIDEDISGLRHCLVQRNHVRCCRRRGVADTCLHLCYKSAESNFSTCTSSLREIIQCFYEGQEDIPSPPRNVFVETQSRTSVVVHWNIPIENVAYLTEYQVLYKVKGSSDFMSKFVSGTTLKHTITVEMNKVYNVKVRACGPHGCSFPSTSMTVSTVSEYFYTDVGNESSVATCCEKERVSSSCQLQFCVGIPRQINLSKMLSCLKFWPRMVKCFAGGRNHTPCCLRNGVNPSCTKYCSGELVDTKQADLACMADFRVIGSCFDAGVRTVPSQPQQFRTALVLSTSIKLQWDAPKRVGTSKAELKYSLLYKNISAGEVNYHSLSPLLKTEATVEDLAEGAVYDLTVVAFNTHGTSLTSTVLRIVTHTIAPLAFKTSPAYDPKQCCRNKGISAACVEAACDLSKSFTSVPISCKPQTMEIAHCVADGRNHSYCCKRNPQINAKCQFMCTLDVVSGLTINAEVVWSCLQTVSFSGLRSCYASGHGVLPSAPRKLRLLAIYPESIKIALDMPTSYPDIAGYKVYVASNGIMEKTVMENSLTHSLSVSGLKPNKAYEIHVTAVTKTGYESLPSNSIGVRTLPKLPAKWYQNKLINFNRDNVTSCCSKNDVSAQCQILCDPSNTTTLTWTADRARTCITDLGKIVGCAVDKRDHTPCCQRRLVPDFCLPMCAGHVDANITNSAVCIQFFPEMRSCFLEGYEILPEAPHVEEIRALSRSSVYLKFSLSEKNKALPGKIINYVYYKFSNSFWNVIQDVKSPYTLSRLRTLTTYSVFVVTVSDNGTSLPSAVYNVTTFPNSPFDVYIVVNPGTLVKRYDLVKMTCRIAIDVPATYTWYHEGRLKKSSGGILEMNVTRDDVGQYACVTQAMGKSVTRDLYLKVQYGLQVIPQQPLVRAGLYDTVNIACTMSGFPETVIWLDNRKNEIPVVSKIFAISTKSNQHFTETQLTILKTTDLLYGEYTCVGSNHYGRVSGKINLVGLNYTGPNPALPPAKVPDDPKACCKSSGVSSECLVACDFKVPSEFFKTNAGCIYEFSRIFQCLTDRRDHTQCCQRRKVPKYCWPICSGQMPTLNRNTIGCFNPTYAGLTVQCMKEGTEKIPTSPQAMKVSNPTVSSLDVSWFAPKDNVEYVESYQIRLRDVEKKTNSDSFINAKKNLRYTISGLPQGRTFLISVRARSLAGDSQFSAQYRTHTLGAPKPPINLHTELIGGVSIRLSWEMPPVSAIEATSYSVVWATEKMEANGILNKNVSAKQELVLPCLAPETKYKFQVVAINNIGESAKSQEEIKMTGKNANPHCTTKKKTVIKYSTDNRHLAAVVILLLLLVIGLGSAGLFVYVNRNNPRYTWPSWVRRLPGMQPARLSVATRDFDNPIHFSNIGGLDDDDGTVTFGGQGSRRRDFGALSTEA